MEHVQFLKMIRLAQAGDEAAADCLFADCYPLLRPFVLQCMDPVFRKAVLEPEDVIQEVYAAAWPKLADGSFENLAAFLAWLKTIARNKIIDLHRGLLAGKNDVCRQVSPQDCGSSTTYLNLAEQAAASSMTPSRGAARQEAVAILVGQIWHLPENYRQVIRWRFVEGLPVSEVARRLDCSEPAVHMLCHRALQKLKELMGSPSKYLTTA